MQTRRPPKELAIDLLPRSPCLEQIAAVLVDGKGRIFAWGWNHPIHRHDQDAGKHAEEHAIERANPARLRGASIYVAGRRASSGAILMARPCDGRRNYRKQKKKPCLHLLRDVGIKRVVYTLCSSDSSHIFWKTLDL